MKKGLVSIFTLAMVTIMSITAYAMPAVLESGNSAEVENVSYQFIPVFDDTLPEGFVPEIVGPGDPRYAEATLVQEEIQPRDISSSGIFSFDFRNTATSQKFKMGGSSSEIWSKATTARSDRTYNISLYESDGSSFSLKKSVKYTADGNKWSYNFTGLSSSKVYYLYFYAPDSNNRIYANGGIANFAGLYK